MTHHCNVTFLVNNPDGKFICQKLDNAIVSNNNTNHKFMPIQNDYSVTCLKIRQHIGLTKKLHIDADGNVLEFKISIPLFHPYRHVPPTNPTNDINISPDEGYNFDVFKSMQNVQVITLTYGCSKYECKYIAKIDKQNYIFVLVDGSGNLV